MIKQKIPHIFISIGEADFIIIDLDLITEERMNISGANILEIVKNGEIFYLA